MDWNEKLQDIIDYVEHHLQRTEEPINQFEIAQMAGCSFDFFQKVFSYMNGISFADYVRCRKLTLAGYDLKSTNLKVLEISYKYGYDSPTSFTKAFQLFHGVSPKEAREKMKELAILPKMQIASKQQYAWRVEQKPLLRLLGKRIQVSQSQQALLVEIPEYWNTCQRDGTYPTLISLDSGTPSGMMGFLDDTSQEYNYTIAVISDKDIPEGFEEIIIPENTWAIFDCRGNIPSAIQKGWKYLYEEWLVKYPFKHAPSPALEWYSDGNVYSEDFLSQIWIPILEGE